MHKSCDSCHARYQREAGFFLGAIYFNYGLTSVIVAIAYPVMLLTEAASKTTLFWGTLSFVVVFPLWFFRYARSLWLAMDQYIDPRPGEELDRNTDTRS